MKTSIHLKRIVVATGFALAIMAGAPIASHHLGFNGYDMISQAHAVDDGGGKGKMGTSGKGSGSKQDKGTGDHGTGSDHGKKDTKVTGSFMGQGDEKRDVTSDRPDYAGVKGGKSGGGTKPSGAGTKKGDLFGDMFILVRNPATGAALTETINGVVYPLVQAFDKDGNPIPGQSIPRDPATGDLLTQLPDGTKVFTSEVELSRLNVARAPTKVLTHSYDEAISKLTAAGAVVTLDAAGRLVVNGTAIDSPLENLALYAAAMAGTLPASITSLPGFSAASLLAASADKTKTVNLDTVMYLDAFLKVSPNLSTFTYDRTAVYSGKTVDVLVKQADGSFKVETVNLLSTITWTTSTPATTGATGFAQAVDDALQVIEFVHDNAVR